MSFHSILVYLLGLVFQINCKLSGIITSSGNVGIQETEVRVLWTRQPNPAQQSKMDCQLSVTRSRKLGHQLLPATVLRLHELAYHRVNDHESAQSDYLSCVPGTFKRS